MPQQKYVVELNGQSFEVELPEEKSASPDDFTGDAVREGGKTLGRNALGFAQMLIGATQPNTPHGAALHQAFGQMITDPKGAAKGAVEDVIGTGDMSMGARTGRTLANIASMLPLGPAASRIPGLGRLIRMPKRTGAPTPTPTVPGGPTGFSVKPSGTAALPTTTAPAQQVTAPVSVTTPYRSFTMSSSSTLPKGMGVGEGVQAATPAPKLSAPAAIMQKTAGKKTVSLAEMVEKYGLEEAAKRANMTVDEVLEMTGKSKPTPNTSAPAARFKLPEVKNAAEKLPLAQKALGIPDVPEEVHLASAAKAKGAAPAKVAAKEKVSSTMTPGEMRRMYGAEKAARRMGVSKEEFLDMADPHRAEPSRVPKVAEQAAEDAAYRNRIADSGPYLYAGIDPRALWQFAKRNPKTAGAATGAALGAASSDEDDDVLGRMALGAMVGTGVGAAPQLKDALLKYRREAALSGAAPLMNVGTAVTAPLTAAVEGLSTQGRMAPIRELFNVPANVRAYKQSRTMGVPAAQSGYISGKPSTSPFMPSRIIRGIDAAGQSMLRRAGVPEMEIDRLLHTGRNIAGESLTSDPTTRELLMFVRTPFNVFQSGMNEMTGMLTGSQKVSPGMGRASAVRPTTKTQRALTAGSMAGGAGIGEYVAEDPEKRGLLGKIALAAMGPRALPGLLGAVVGQAAQGKAARLPLGSVSPIPEFVFDPRLFVGKPTLLKLLQDQGVIAKEE